MSPPETAAVAEELCDVAEWTGPPVWLHGDLHTANVIVRDGSVVGVLDFGDITSGDPACDLAIAWMLFDGADRDRFRSAAGAVVPIDDATWQRGRAWALHFALLYLLNSADNERFARMGRSLVAAVLSAQRGGTYPSPIERPSVGEGAPDVPSKLIRTKDWSAVDGWMILGK